ERRGHRGHRGLVVGEVALNDMFGSSHPVRQYAAGPADPLGESGRVDPAVVSVHHLVLQRRRAGVDDQDGSRHCPCAWGSPGARDSACAWIAVIATVLTMSCTEAPRDRSLTG